MENINFNVKGDYIYFKGYEYFYSDKMYYNCRVKINTEKVYGYIKKSNLTILYGDIINDYIERKKQGIRGYKTLNLGYIEKFNTISKIEYEILDNKGNKIWWIDHENKIQCDNINEIRSYVKSFNSNFIKIK